MQWHASVTASCFSTEQSPASRPSITAGLQLAAEKTVCALSAPGCSRRPAWRPAARCRRRGPPCPARTTKACQQCILERRSQAGFSQCSVDGARAKGRCFAHLRVVLRLLCALRRAVVRLAGLGLHRNHLHQVDADLTSCTSSPCAAQLYAEHVFQPDAPTCV